MSRFVFLMYGLPIVLTAIGWGLGRASFGRALKTMVVIFALVEVSMVVALWNGCFADPTLAIFSTFALLIIVMISVWASFFMSLTAPARNPAPIVVAAQATAAVYEGLTPQQKEGLQKAARLGAKVAAQGAAHYAKTHGWVFAASMLRRASRHI